MSSVSLQPILESHPELADVTRDVEAWLNDRPHRSFLDSRAILRDFGAKYAALQIIDFFGALKSLRLANTYFRIIDDRGNFIEGKYNNFEDVPVEVEDSSGSWFAVERENVVQVYEFLS